MTKRTIKPAAGESRVSIREATSAARVVHRDVTSGHFVILERDRSSRIRYRSSGMTLSRGFQVRKDSAASHSESVRRASKKK